MSVRGEEIRAGNFWDQVLQGNMLTVQCTAVRAGKGEKEDHTSIFLLEGKTCLEQNDL